MNEMICKKIQTNVSMWKEDLETERENIEIIFPRETNSYY